MRQNLLTVDMFGDQNSLFLNIVLAACSLYSAQKTCVRLEHKREPKKGLCPQNMNTLVNFTFHNCHHPN